MPYVIQPKFSPVYLAGSMQLVIRREVELEKYLALDKAKEKARAMVADDGALSATVYEMTIGPRKVFKLRWERVAGGVVMVDGILGLRK